jgi:hypothetical protein
MGPPLDLLRQAGRRWGSHVCRSGHMAWLDAALWSPPNTAMPWGPNNDESPGSNMEEAKAYLVTHPDIATWRLAYRDLHSHWLYGDALPAQYLDTSLHHLCGGLTWQQFATLLRSPPRIPDYCRGYQEDTRPRCPKAFASRHSATGTGTAPWIASGAASGSSYTLGTSPIGAGPLPPPGTRYVVIRHTPPRIWPTGLAPHFGNSTSPFFLDRGPVIATPLLPPPWLGPTRCPAGGERAWNLQNVPLPPL